MFCCPSHGTECEVRRTPGPSLARRRRWTSFRSSLPSRASPYCTRRRQRCVATKPDYVGQIRAGADTETAGRRSEEHTSELQSQSNLVCRLLLEKNKINT